MSLGERKNKNAFTLAEVLITLLIIGVISSIVIPSLIQDSQKQELYTAFRKEYSNIANAAKLMMLDNGGTFDNFFTGQYDMMNKFGNYVSYTHKCPSGQHGCFYVGTTSWKVLGGQDGWFDFTDYPTAIMNNGALIRFNFLSSDCTTDYGDPGGPTEHSCGWVDIDVNGFKSPNILGRDIFRIYVTKTGIFPSGIPKERFSNPVLYCNKDSTDAYNGRACAVKVLKGEDIP